MEVVVQNDVTTSQKKKKNDVTKARLTYCI